MNLFLHVDYEKVYFRGGLVCNVLCGYRFLERTTLLVLSECLSISHIIAMQLLYHMEKFEDICWNLHFQGARNI